MSEHEQQNHQHGAAVQLNLRAQAADLLAEAGPTALGHSARTLIKEGPLRLTLLALLEGREIKEHRAGGPVSIAIINDGAAVIEAAGRRYQLEGHDVLVLDAGVSHSVHAERDTVLLLTIAMPI